jgi:GNAT superfamily N-acetyltransferase
MKALLRRLAHLIFPDYRVNWIFASTDACPVPLATGNELRRINEDIREQLTRSRTPKVANSVTYTRAGMDGFVIMRSGAPLCVAHFASTQQYTRAKTWPLRAGERALMDIATEQSARGRGLAPQLIAASCRHYRDEGVRQLIAFVWWSNKPSIRAFTKAGWRRTGLSIEVLFAGRWRRLHIRLGRSAAARATKS